MEEPEPMTVEVMKEKLRDRSWDTGSQFDDID